MGDAPVLHTVPAPGGPARCHLTAGDRGLLVLGHGAGGGLDAPDLLAAREAAVLAGMAVALVEQPWRVAGRRVAGPPPTLDAAWTAVVVELGGAGPLVVGGRSAGARVACRTAEATAAAAVLCLAFPLVARSGRSREPELRAPAVPRLVVQGSRDPFGVPEPSDGVEVHVVQGADHCFRVRRADGRSAPEVRAAVRAEVRGAVGRWLAQVLT